MSPRRGEYAPHNQAVKAESERKIRENVWSPFIALRQNELSHSLPWKDGIELNQEYGFCSLRWECESERKFSTSVTALDLLKNNGMIVVCFLNI